MEHGDPVRIAPTDAEVERAIASVPGVVHAAVTRSDDGERSRLRIRLAPGEEPEGIAWAVAATLRERFDIALDPAAIRPAMTEHSAPFTAETADTVAPTGDPTTDPVRLVTTPPPVDVEADPSATVASAEELRETRERLTAALEALTVVDAPAEPASDAPVVAPTDEAASDADPRSTSQPTTQPTAPPASEPATVHRPSIRTLDTQRDASDVRVTASLEHLGRVVQGDAIGLATAAGSLRAVAEATVAALRQCAAGDLHVGIDHVSLQPAVDPATASVVVTLLTDRGEERLVGASLLRDDPELAVMRATLDALNRRVAPYLEPDLESDDDGS